MHYEHVVGIPRIGRQFHFASRIDAEVLSGRHVSQADRVVPLNDVA